MATVKKKSAKTGNLSAKKELVTGTALRQKKFIAAYVNNNFHIGRACMVSGVGRSTFGDWKLTDPAFQADWQDAIDEKLDQWEEALHVAAINGDTVALIFGLKCLAASRGYTEHNVTKQAVKLLQQAQSGDISVIDAGYEFAKLGLPLPEILALQLKKTTVDVALSQDFSGLSTEEMERRAQERFDAVQKQREEFLPERRAEVAEIKERLKDQDSFAPDRFEGESA
jgi:predicted transcriptional regulator